MKSRPLHDRVFIRRADGDLKSNRGIIISDIAKEKSRGGEVIAVGSGTRDEGGKLKPLDLKAGDTILFGNGPAPSEDRRPGTDHERGRPHGHRRKDRRDQESCLTADFRPRNLKTELDERHVCQGNQILH